MARGMKTGGRVKGSVNKKTIDSTLAAQDAIKKKFGTIEAGILNLIESGEPSLIKFAWEHAIGKAPDIIQGEIQNTIITIRRGNRSTIE